MICSNADDAAVQYFGASLQFKKPVVLTETGNAGHNWDPVSHLRMRIRSWVAFFKGKHALPPMLRRYIDAYVIHHMRTPTMHPCTQHRRYVDVVEHVWKPKLSSLR